MTTSQKLSGLAFVSIIGGSLIAYYFQQKALDKKLTECSVYTAANITRIYRLRGFLYAEYNYKLGNKVIKVDEGVNYYDIFESSASYQQKLESRKYFFLKVYCNDPNIHQLIWDVQVPDTLTKIPVNGWLRNLAWAIIKDK